MLFNVANTGNTFPLYANYAVLITSYFMHAFHDLTSLAATVLDAYLCVSHTHGPAWSRCPTEHTAQVILLLYPFTVVEDDSLCKFFQSTCVIGTAMKKASGTPIAKWLCWICKLPIQGQVSYSSVIHSHCILTTPFIITRPNVATFEYWAVKNRVERQQWDKDNDKFRVQSFRDLCAK